MIALKNVTHTYKTEAVHNVTAIDNMTLSIKKGEMVAIIGTSGAGKSTVLKIIGLTIPVDSGEYFFDGENITNCTDKKAASIRNHRIAFVMQDFALINQFTVYENAETPLMLNSNKFSSSMRKKLVMPVLESLGISELANRPVTKLSGGQKQRTAIARAISSNADVLLADEPTGSLDSKTTEEIMELFLKLNKEGKTIIIVTHDKQIAQKCNRIIELSDGKIVSDTDLTI